MSPYDRAVVDAKLGIKALQNMAACVKYLELMASIQDPWLLSALFCSAVVRYARPFSQPPAGRGSRAYSEKLLKRRAGFLPEVHKHLMGIRNTLVAHDDMESIEPKFLTTSATVGDSLLMASISVSNKCLAYPIEGATAQMMLSHARACVEGIDEKLAEDLALAREEGQRNPASMNVGVKLSRSGTTELSEGQGAAVPDFTHDPWFTPDHPNFSSVHNGFVYDELRYKKDYFGTFRVTMPDGNWQDVIIGPPNATARGRTRRGAGSAEAPRAAAPSVQSGLDPQNRNS